ncbi:MAG: hypothetical protein JXA57_12445 [Armatimonadetes bacterium]|nr:hypothetical protein [Armatimonadota bacterium]
MSQDEILGLYTDAQRSVDERVRNSSGDYQIPEWAQTTRDFADSVLNVLKEVPAVSIGAAGIQETMARSVDLYERTQREEAQVDSWQSEHAEYVGLRNIQESILSQAVTIAREYPEFAEAFDGRWSRDFNALLSDSEETIRQNNPDFGNNSALQDLTNLVNSLEAGALNLDEFTAELKGLLASNHSQVMEMIGAMTAQLADLNTQQTSLIDYVRNGPPLSEAQRQRKLDEQNIARAQAAVSIVSKVLGHIDSEVGRKAYGIGTASLQIADSISKFRLTATGGFNTATAMGGLMLAGNIFGAVSSVVSLFGTQGPSADEQILEQLQAISQQIDEFRVEMHERFDRVDKRLNELFQLLAEVAEELTRINERLDDIQERLGDIQKQLTQFEANMREYLQDIDRATFVESLYTCPDYQWQMWGEPASGRFSDCLVSAFYTWASIHSRESLWSGICDGFESSDVLRHLQNPTFREITYLGCLAADLGYPNMQSSSTDGRFANPIEWALATNAYLDLLREWPEYLIQNGGDNRLHILGQIERLVTVGSEITNGVQALRQKELFDKLFSDYRKAADDVFMHISTRRREIDWQPIMGSFAWEDLDIDQTGIYPCPEGNVYSTAISSGSDPRLLPMQDACTSHFWAPRVMWIYQGVLQSEFVLASHLGSVKK